MTTSQSAKIALDAAMAEFESIDVTKRYFWANVESLRQHLQGELNRFKTAMHNPMGRPLDLGNTLSTPLGEVRCQTQLANSKTMIDFLVESEEFKTADSIIAPAVANVRAAEEKLREAIDEENQVEQAG